MVQHFCRCFCIVSLKNTCSYSPTKPKVLSSHKPPQISIILTSIPLVNPDTLTQNQIEQNCQLVWPTSTYDFQNNQIYVVWLHLRIPFYFYPTYHLQWDFSPVRPECWLPLPICQIFLNNLLCDFFPSICLTTSLSSFKSLIKTLLLWCLQKTWENF